MAIMIMKNKKGSRANEKPRKHWNSKRERERERESFSKPIKKFFIIKKLEKQYKIKDKLHFIV